MQQMKFKELFNEFYKKFSSNKILGIPYIWLVLFIFIFSFLIQLIYVLSPYVPWWDEAIYIGMAKFISSFGELGHWEYFRPPLWPIFLGVFLKLGLTIKGLNVIQVFVSMSILFLTFLFSEKIKKNTGLLAVLILSTTFLYFYFVHILLSEYLSLMFSLAALYLFANGKYFFSGISASLSFLTRFPEGLLIVVLGLAIFAEFIKPVNIKSVNLAEALKIRLLKVIKNGFMVLIGFLVPLIPYFIINHIYYGGYLNPIIFGAEVAEMSAPFYSESLLFYFKTILSNNFLYIFSIIFFIMFFKKKLWDNSKNTLLFLAILLFFAYFTHNPHKEARYIMVALPYLAIAASYGIHTSIDSISSMKSLKKYFNMSEIFCQFVNVGRKANQVLTNKKFLSTKNSQSDSNRFIRFCRSITGSSLLKVADVIYAVIVIILVLVGISFMLTIPKYQQGFTKTQEEFYTFFADDTNNILLAANPIYLLFTNKPITFLANWENAISLLNNAKNNNADYVAFNTCQYQCLDEECEKFKIKFMDILDIYPLIFNKTEAGCDYLIYSLPFAEG